MLVQLFLLTALAVPTRGALLAPRISPIARCAGRCTAVRAVLADPDIGNDSLLGSVLSVSTSGLVAIKPEERELAKVGSLLSFAGGSTGVVLAERCGVYFACSVEGTPPAASESAMLLPRNLTVQTWDGDSASWGGLFDYRGERQNGQSDAATASTGTIDVFREPVSAAQRYPISGSMHTGVVAIDALAPIGRGQSMMLFGPDTLPAGSSRTDIALRAIRAQQELGSGVRCVLVLTEAPEARQQTLAALEAAGALENTKVLVANNEIEAKIAASAACSIAEACSSEDVLVVIDSLRPQLQLWRSICRVLSETEVAVTAEEEGSQQRAYYSSLVERAARRKEGGSVTLLLLQPSVSVLPRGGAKAEYTLADFTKEGFTNTVCTRVKMLESKGIKITEEVLVKVGIPLPGSDHPVAGKGQRSQQHLEELTSLVDGHLDLRENLAAKGIVPPIDPCNSLTRIGVGSTKLRPLSMTSAMAAVTSALRLSLAAASDPVHCEDAERRRANAYLAVLQQDAPTPLALGEEVTLLFAASSGLLDAPVDAAAADREAIGAVVARVLEYVRAEEPELIPRITESGLLSDATRARLQELVAAALQ